MNDLTFLKELGPLGGGIAGVIFVVILFLKQITAMSTAFAEASARQHQEVLESLANCQRVIQSNTVAMTEQRLVIEAVLEAVKR